VTKFSLEEASKASSSTEDLPQDFVTFGFFKMSGAADIISEWKKQADDDGLQIASDKFCDILWQSCRCIVLDSSGVKPDFPICTPHLILNREGPKYSRRWLVLERRHADISLRHEEILLRLGGRDSTV